MSQATSVDDVRGVHRQRLSDQLDQPARVQLVVAPPGYGKTTAVRHWAARRTAPTAWLTIDLLTSTDALFWQQFIHAVRALHPQIDEEPALLLAERGSDDPLFFLSLIDQLRSQSSGSTLVLDDISAVSSHAIAAGLQAIVERVGDVLQLVLIGRSDPMMPIAQWRASGWLSDIRAEQLRLTDDEALAVASSFGASPRDDASVTQLNRRLDGWPIALTLSLMSTTGAPTPAHVLPSTQRVLADYLVTTVLDRLSGEESDALLSLSVLEWFDAELCRALLGDRGAGLIASLRRRLFITELTDRPGAMRFHALFRELLLQELRWRDPERFDERHRDAAHELHRRGDTSGAHRLLTAIGDHEAARQLFLAPALAVLGSGGQRAVGDLLELVPGTAQVDDTSLALEIAFAWAMAGRMPTALQWRDHAVALAERDPSPPLAELHSTQSLIALLDGFPDVALSHLDAWEAIEIERSTSSLPNPWWALTGLGVAVACAGSAQARTWLQRAERITGPPNVVEVTLPALRAAVVLQEGRVDVASQLASEAWAHAQRRGISRHRGALDALVVNGWCQLGTGDLAAALASSETAAELSAGIGTCWDVVRTTLLSAEIQRCAGLPDAALITLARLQDAVDLAPRRAVSDAVELMVASASISAGREPPRDPERLPLGAGRSIVTARRAAADRRRDDVLAALTQAIDWPLPAMLEVELLRAAMAPPGEDLRRAGAVVRRGADSGWVSPFLGHGDLVVRSLLNALPLERIHPALFSALRADLRTPRVKTDPPPEPLTPREETVLELLPTHLSYAQIGERLYLSVNTVKSNLKSIYRKLGVATRSQAVDAAMDLGLARVQPPEADPELAVLRID